MSLYLIPATWITLGLCVLLVGGELLVRGAAALAAAVRISPLVIGLTVVAFGTSAPELAVSVQSGMSGQGDLALGNVAGSNIANVLLILGISALITPLVVSSQLVRFDVPLMVAVSVLLVLVAADGRISRADGLLFVVGLLVYTGWSIWQGRREGPDVQKEFAGRSAASVKSGTRAIALHLGKAAVGLTMLAIGGRWLIHGAVDIARLVGVSELVIGLTIVAVGTSLPEVVTSILASIRGERDIAVGNVVGSNLFNVLCVLGVASVVSPDGLAVSRAAIQFDIPVMVAVALSCLPIFFTDSKIARWEGGLFFGYYVAYVTHLVLAATQSSFSRTFATMMLGFVVPLTVVTLFVCSVRYIRSVSKVSTYASRRRARSANPTSAAE
jgi:cation:H+ antiporter